MFALRNEASKTGKNSPTSPFFTGERSGYTCLPMEINSISLSTFLVVVLFKTGYPCGLSQIRKYSSHVKCVLTVSESPASNFLDRGKEKLHIDNELSLVCYVTLELSSIGYLTRCPPFQVQICKTIATQVTSGDNGPTFLFDTIFLS